MAIFIACLGLLALVAYVAEQRTREIGIRKVLGATPASIVVLINKDLVRLSLMAMIIASPQQMCLKAQNTDFSIRSYSASTARCFPRGT